MASPRTASRLRDPARPERLAAWQALFQPLAVPKLRLAVLGFVAENGRSRWLTNAEISAGVGRALESVKTR